MTCYQNFTLGLYLLNKLNYMEIILKIEIDCCFLLK